MNIKNVEVMGFEGAFRGMRNPYDSWSKSDSITAISSDHTEQKARIEYKLGRADMELACRLIRGGTEHRKFLRQILVSFDITAPLYLWKELDTYKVGTVANSCSTMHTISKYPFSLSMFEMTDYNKDVYEGIDFNWDMMIDALESLRKRYLETKDKAVWKELVRLLPTSFLQMRTLTMNYETLLTIHRQRKGHRLSEWKYIIDWIESLPYMKEFISIAEERK